LNITVWAAIAGAGKRQKIKLLDSRAPIIGTKETPNSGIAAFFGAWPGDETDEELLTSLKDSADDPSNCCFCRLNPSLHPALLLLAKCYLLNTFIAVSVKSDSTVTAKY
jgi:hypothetical protein